MNDAVVVNGETDPAWAGVRAAFAENIAEGLDDGASLAVSVDGVPVVDVWGGPDPITGRAWERDSVTIGFSVTKGRRGHRSPAARRAGARRPRRDGGHLLAGVRGSG